MTSTRPACRECLAFMARAIQIITPNKILYKQEGSLCALMAATHRSPRCSLLCSHFIPVSQLRPNGGPLPHCISSLPPPRSTCANQQPSPLASVYSRPGKVITGISLGLQESLSSAIPIFMSLALHKSVEALALGVNLVRTGKTGVAFLTVR